MAINEEKKLDERKTFLLFKLLFLINCHISYLLYCYFWCKDTNLIASTEII